MSGPEARFRHWITWWRRSGTDAAGDPSFAAPIPMLGHWTERTDRYLSPEGAEKYSIAVVHVPRDMSIGDFLYKGRSVATDPLAVAGAAEIGGWRRSASPNEQRVLRRAYL